MRFHPIHYLRVASRHILDYEDPFWWALDRWAVLLHDGGWHVTNQRMVIIASGRWPTARAPASLRRRYAKAMEVLR